MKKLFILFILFLFVRATIFSQTNTAIYVFDVQQNDETYQLTNQKNISDSKGYNNQPFFYDDEHVIFASTRNDFTDIFLYNLKNNTKRFICKTPKRDEYSPQKKPNSTSLSAVRLDADDLQHVDQYDFATGKNKEIILDLKVAYSNWFDQNTLLAVVIYEIKNGKIVRVTFM